MRFYNWDGQKNKGIRQANPNPQLLCLHYVNLLNYFYGNEKLRTTYTFPYIT